MARIVQVTLPAEDSAAVGAELAGLDGLVSLRIDRGSSVKPAGDVLTATVTSTGLRNAMHVLDRRGLGRNAQSSIVSSEPLSVISAPWQDTLLADDSEATWEEIESQIGKESNQTLNGLLLMALAGVLTVAGLTNNALHFVIGAMIIAPGFEPISRMALGVVNGSGALRRGLRDTVKAYLALILGAAAATLVVTALGWAPLGKSASYLPGDSLLSFWTTINSLGLLVSVCAGIAGGILMASNRTVLTAGVMIALSLVPSAALVGMGMASLRADLVTAGAMRWAIEVVIVALTSMLVFGWKRYSIHRRLSST
jgi:uncharacterized hydrophobic protein (TIGR00271 family)